MHDASEAYLGDVSTPLKQLLPDYKTLEAKWEKVIQDKFHLRSMSADVKRADQMALRAELDVLVIRNGSRSQSEDPDYQQIDLTDMRRLLAMGTEDATIQRAEFLRRFHELMTERFLSHMDAITPRADP